MLNMNKITKLIIVILALLLVTIGSCKKSSDNDYPTYSEWGDNNISNGAVFLPAGGFRFVNLIQSVNVVGCYWTSTPYYDEFALYSFVYNIAGNISIDGPRHAGICVRLVCDYE